MKNAAPLEWTEVPDGYASPDQLKEILAQARAEQWHELTLWGSHASYGDYNKWLSWPGRCPATATHSLQLTTSLRAEGARALAGLDSLTSLNLYGNSIGDEGVDVLAALPHLTALDLRYNDIGAEGTRALAAMINLTWLDLSFNHIGDAGARALAALTNLTVLDLQNNAIGPEGARALLAAWVDAPTNDRLEYLQLMQNGDLSSVLPLPSDLIGTTDAQATLAVYRRQRLAGAERMLHSPNRAKPLVWGPRGGRPLPGLKAATRDVPLPPEGVRRDELVLPETDPERLAFNPPARMKVGRRERVPVHLSHDLAATLTESLRGKGAPQIAAIEIERLRVRLLGNDFDITALNHEDQLVRGTGFTQWDFDVVPRRSGRRALRLLVTLRLSHEDTQEFCDLPALESEILVQTAPVYAVTRSLAPIGNGSLLQWVFRWQPGWLPI